VKCLWTDSIRLMSFSLYGDHAWDAYSRSGLTHTLKVLAMVAGSLERKHLCIRLEVYDSHWQTKLTAPETISFSRDMIGAHQNLNSSRELYHSPFWDGLPSVG